MKKIRCAIYTRKSAEEGLEQEFNSLDAQREACAAYVASHKAEGWVLLPTVYEDAGLSGGTLERPGLQRLLDDIDAGLVEQIVVYKVDRLTRSLSDFAKLVERLEAAGAVFLSVTQSFNTATRVVAECPPWVRHWRSYARTRCRKTRESELGGVAPKVCSQTRRKLAKSKPSKTTFRPTPVSCGITERSLLCSIKSSLMRDFRVRSSLPVARPTADLSQPCAPPVGLSLATRSSRGRKPALRRETPSILRGFQGRLSC